MVPELVALELEALLLVAGASSKEKMLVELATLPKEQLPASSKKKQPAMNCGNGKKKKASSSCKDSLVRAFVAFSLQPKLQQLST